MKLILFLAVLCAAGGVFAFHEHQAAAREARELGAVATGLAGRPVRVQCQNIAAAAIDVSDEQGAVTFDASGRPSDTAHLKRNTCQALGRFPRDARAGKLRCLAAPDSCPDAVLADALAVHVLTHESMHLRGIQSESEAECLALGATAWTARDLGAPPTDANLVEQYARTRLYELLPADYHSPACGG